MSDLRWSWLCVPFIVCAGSLVAMGLVAALVRGDRVLRLGVVGAATAALPWAMCSAITTCTDDPGVATRLLRLGLASVSLIGPNLLLVLLGVSGQLERHRWAARLAGLVGAVLLGVCLSTSWTVPGVRRLSSGVYYVTAGPLTDVHIAQLGIWLAVGAVIARQSMMRGERRRMVRVLVIAFVLAAIGSTDMLLVHGVLGAYPIAWLPATLVCGIALYLELATDLLRPRGLDTNVAWELAGFVVAALLIGALAFLVRGAAPVVVAVLGSAAWMAVIAIMWALGRRRPPPRVFAARALAWFVAGLADPDDDKQIAQRLTVLWLEAQIAVRATWRAERGAPTGATELVEITTGAVWQLDREVASWLVGHGEPLSAADLATMRLGAMRAAIEVVLAARGATLFVPLIDRGTLAGLVEADHALALREAEHGLVAESARAVARALTYLDLARMAAREGATAREVEVAEAMRLAASARGDGALGPWMVAAEHRSAPRTTGAAWSATVYGDGRLALLVTEGQSHGVVSALATAALSGAFAAATTAIVPPDLDELLQALRASAESVLRGGEPIAAFVALLDAERETIAWGCAGHPGAHVIGASRGSTETGPGPIPLGGGGASLGDAFGVLMRGEAAFGRDMVLVVSSSGLRGGASSAWYAVLRAHAAAGSRLATLLVEAAQNDGPPSEDLLAVVVRPVTPRHGDLRSSTLSRQGVP